jgi:4-carboxymuconolactone decarboxylase
MNQDLYDAGMAMRRRVLGDAYVDASLAAATDFTRDIQEYVTQYCWGDLWNRPGLGLRERSLINLAMLIALNRANEFKAHVRGALNNGVSRDQIKEVLMQSAFYCGGPAALEAFRNAAEVFAAMDAEAQAAQDQAAEERAAEERAVEERAAAGASQ